MKKIYYFLFIVLISSFSSCKDETDLDSLVNFPPSILSINPNDGSRVAMATFDEIKVVLLDAPRSPLVSGTITLKDAENNVLAKIDKNFSGTKDSLLITNDELSALTLGEGTYKLEVSAVDTDGLTLSHSGEFMLVNSLYASNQTEMYIAGEFNGWGAGEMELVADYIWEIKNVDLAGGKWKFKNTPDWTDKDWGDADCDGVMQETTGGGPDTDCGYSGLVHIQFNDKTLAYTIMPAVNYERNITALYLLGNFNQFQGDDAAFKQTTDNVWVLEEIRLKAGDAFKFSESPAFEGKNFGDNEMDGIADEFGSNIVLPDTYEDAFYKITFNDKSLAYTLELVRYPYPENAYLVGGSTSAGWNTGNSIPFVKTGDGTFEIYAYLDVSDGFKILEVQDWAGDWGKGADGELLQEGESNITVPANGFYRITVDFVNKTYMVTETNWAIIGDATPNGWADPDTDMMHSGLKGDYTWKIENVTLTDGKLKFRANDAWDINFGDNEADGILELGGSDIPVAAGTFTIILTLDPVNGYTYTIQ